MSVLPSQQMTNNNLLTFCRPWLPMSHIILHPGVARSPAGQRVVFIAKGLEGAQQQCDANLCPSAGLGSHCRTLFCSRTLSEPPSTVLCVEVNGLETRVLLVLAKRHGA